MHHTGRLMGYLASFHRFFALGHNDESALGYIGNLIA
jgi:hypothetical protein